MARICELISTTKEGYVTIGTWTFDSGKITVRAKKGHEIIMRESLDQRHFINRGETPVTSKSDPEAWFESLPRYYNGSMLNAVMV